MNDLFRYIGDESDGLGYKTGKVYMLELTGRGATELKIVVEAPIRAYYDSYEDLLKDWERI